MKKILLLSFLAVLAWNAAAQKTWTLQECLDYAMDNNIQLQQIRNQYLSGLEDTEQARAALFPTLTASSTQGVSASPFMTGGPSTGYNGSYGLNSNVTLYHGGRLRNAIRAQEVQNRRDSLSVEENAIDIRIAIVQAYLRCLYADEAVSVNENTVAVARAQRDRAYQMWKAGSISKVDFAQLESQLYNDEYQLTSSRTNLDSYRLQLKQLLELDIDEVMLLSDIEASEEEVLRILPPKSEVYERALENMPDIADSQLAVTAAEIAEKQAKAGYLPTLGASAGLGTSNRSGTGNAFTRQIQDNFNVNAGLSLSIPIITGRQNKTALNKARIALENSRLAEQSARKSVLRDVETTYLDAVSAQAQYISATEKEKYAEQSFSLTSEQFQVGIKNTVELITASNEYLSARVARLQAKYMALLNLKVLDIYQGNA